jgi:hypothetical protein
MMKKTMKRSLCFCISLLFAGSAYAQAPGNGDHSWATPGNATVPGSVQLCPNAAGIAVPCTNGTGSANFPAGATPVTASATGTTAAVVATLPGVAGKTTYICGFSYQGSDATAAQNGILVISGTISGSLNYGYPTLALGATVPQPSLAGDEYIPCIPASAVNTSIVVTSPALGAGATVATVAAWGFQY